METKEHVEYLLKNYHEMKRSLDRLNFEIERFTGLSYTEVITALTFTNPDGERVQNSGVSDKTSRIALAYRESTDKLNCDDALALVMRYDTQKREMDVLEYCITLLEPKLSEVITDMFINKMTWDGMCDKYYVSQPMLSKYRRKAIGELAKMLDVKQAG
jgi:uncharacterized protein with ParB-like and HNH nuclease domain